MKAVLLLIISSSVVWALSPVPSSKKPAKTGEVVKKQSQNHFKKSADCDEKAKKPIEIKPESISLSGATGCSLDEVKP
jgi:hypothetical protein